MLFQPLATRWQAPPFPRLRPGILEESLGSTRSSFLNDSHICPFCVGRVEEKLNPEGELYSSDLGRSCIQATTETRCEECADSKHEANRGQRSAENGSRRASLCSRSSSEVGQRSQLHWGFTPTRRSLPRLCTLIRPNLEWEVPGRIFEPKWVRLTESEATEATFSRLSFESSIFIYNHCDKHTRLKFKTQKWVNPGQIIQISQISHFIPTVVLVLRRILSVRWSRNTQIWVLWPKGHRVVTWRHTPVCSCGLMKTLKFLFKAPQTPSWSHTHRRVESVSDWLWLAAVVPAAGQVTGSGVQGREPDVWGWCSGHVCSRVVTVDILCFIDWKEV